LLGLAAVLPVAFGLAAGADISAGVLSGAWGGMLAYYTARAFGMAGAWIIVLLLLTAVTVATLRWNPVRVIVGHRVLAGLGSGARFQGTPAALALEPSPEEMPALDPSLDPALDAETPEHAQPSKSRGRRRRNDGAAQEPDESPETSGGRAARGPASREERIAAEIDATEHVPAEVGEEMPPTTLLA